MTDCEFRKDPHKVERLKAILADPVLQEAFAVIRDELYPEANGAFRSEAQIAAEYHHAAGFKRTLNLLNRLTLSQEQIKKITPKALAKTLDDLPKTEK